VGIFNFVGNWVNINVEVEEILSIIIVGCVGMEVEAGKVIMLLGWEP
jgi:hypothetical protein